MIVHLERTVTDHIQHRRYNIYRRDDGRYWVLITPTDPGRATKKNVMDFVCDTREQAYSLQVVEV